MRRYVPVLALLGLALVLSGCVYPYGYYRGGGWCYYHPHRC